MMKQKLISILAAAVLLNLSACASFDEAQNKKSAQLAHIQALQKEAQTLVADKTGEDAYAPTKAIAWLDFALDEHHDEDQSGVTEGAIGEAEKIINALKANETSNADTPIIAGSDKVRDDLWQKSAALKQSAHYDCGAKQLANLDVQLVWTGHEHWEAGWSHAKTSSEVADNLAFEAEQAIKQCEMAEAAAPAEQVSAPTSTTNTVEVIVEKYNFSSEALFAFNKSGIEYLVLGGRHRLDKLISDINTWQQVETIEVHGYADEIGSQTYNQKLSEARANTVRDYLVVHGVKTNISAIGYGEADPVSACSSKQSRDKRIECLQADRRVELIVRGKK